MISLFRLLLIAFNGRELFVDEAQYWSWSQHLAWGYHSKPPLIAWFIALSSYFLGSSEFAIRFFSPFTYALGSYAVFLTTKELYNPRSAFWAGLSWLVLPSVSISAGIMSTDPFMLMAEAFVLYSFVKSLKTNSLIYWCLLGFFLGMSILSKYTGLFFAFSILLYLVWSAPKRKLLTQPGIYFSLAISLCLLLPNILWNASHHFLAFEHVSHHNLALNQIGFHPTSLIKFWLAQTGILGPFFLIALILLIKQYRGLPLRDADKLILSFVLPLFITVSLEELLVHGYDNWAAPIYIPLVIWLSHYLLESKSITYLQWNLRFSLLIMLIAYSLEIILHLNNWQLNDRINPFKRQQGWHQTQNEMKQLYAHYKNFDYILDGRVIFFKNLYYVNLNPMQASLLDPKQTYYNEAATQTWREATAGKDFVFITNNPNRPDIYKEFYSVKLIKQIKLPVSKDKTETIYWLLLSDYRPNGQPGN